MILRQIYCCVYWKEKPTDFSHNYHLVAKKIIKIGKKIIHCLLWFSLEDKRKITVYLVSQEKLGEALAEVKVIKERSDETA